MLLPNYSHKRHPGPTRSFPGLVQLSDDGALDPNVVGAKAAALARSLKADLPVLPGFAIPISAVEAGRHTTLAGLRDAWGALSEEGALSLVVRSSSSAEDTATSSMAGVFDSILGVTDWKMFLDAIERVVASAGGEAPMAVLVQRELDPSIAGVMFTVDPLSGRADRIAISWVEGSPADLVHGAVPGHRHVVTTHGRVLRAENGEGSGRLGGSQRLRLVKLARAAVAHLGGPQDIEWAFDSDGKLWLFQSRPITAVAAAAPSKGPVYGPGPIAETFPDALSPLEEDLWVEPLRRGLEEALVLSGVASRRRIQKADVVTSIGGRVAIDLDLIGARQVRGFLRKVDPRPGMRRLGASWRVGRLRAAFPSLASALITQIEEALEEVPDLRTLDTEQLIGLLYRGRDALTALHGHEVLAGLLIRSNGELSSGAGAGLRALAYGRSEGFTDDEIVARYPIVLTLVAPALGRSRPLPATPPSIPRAGSEGDAIASARENLRFRVRLVQELTARAAGEISRRLKDGAADSIEWLRLDELYDFVIGAVIPLSIEERIPKSEQPPLPAAFRLDANGGVAAIRDGMRSTVMKGVSAGRAVGRVRHDAAAIESGDVLVVGTLDPDLAGVLPSLGAIISETGSELSHLAILARELQIPVIVGVADALELYPEGMRVLVDGSTGDVEIVDAEPAGSSQ